jgi:hypothetical protein
MPCASKVKIDGFRRQLDRMRAEDACWTPYADRRANHPFDDRALFAGYLSCGDLIYRYLPERVMRQFGYVQYIPRSPHDLPYLTTPVEIFEHWEYWEEYIIQQDERGPPANPAW